MGTGSPCYERPRNEKELKLEKYLCQAEPADSVERKPGGRCVNPHIETDRERDERETRCFHEEFEKFERLRKQFEIPISPGSHANEAADREFLIDAGVDPKVADILAQYDRGYGPGPAIAAMQEASGASGNAFYDFHNSLKSEEDLDKFRKFVKLARRINADRQGVFTRSAEVDADLNALLKLGHGLFGDRFPAPERIPDSPPQVAELLGERDSNGYGSYPAIAAMLTASGATGEAWNNFLTSLKSAEDIEKLRKFVMLARRITASGKSVFARSSEADADLNALLKLGHELFGDRFPAPERLPDRP